MKCNTSLKPCPPIFTRGNDHPPDCIPLVQCQHCQARFYSAPIVRPSACSACGGRLEDIGLWDMTLQPFWPLLERGIRP